MDCRGRQQSPQIDRNQNPHPATRMGWSLPLVPEELPLLGVETRFMMKDMYRKATAISEVARPFVLGTFKPILTPP